MVTAYEEDNKLIDVETNCEISIGSEICDQEHIDHAHRHEPILMSESTHEEPSESYNDIIDINRGTCFTSSLITILWTIFSFFLVGYI